MSNVKNFETATFDEQVLAARLPVLVDFSAEWCGPCKTIAPVVEKLADEFSERMLFGTLDVDHNPDIAMRFGVMGMPTIGVFLKGKMVDRQVGYAGSPRLREFVERHLGGA
jgi:thioredoxin 1